MGTIPGLKFDTTLVTVKAGSRVRLVFRNGDDMLHNFVICAPGKGQAVGAAADADRRRRHGEKFSCPTAPTFFTTPR